MLAKTWVVSMVERGFIDSGSAEVSRGWKRVNASPSSSYTSASDRGKHDVTARL